MSGLPLPIPDFGHRILILGLPLPDGELTSLRTTVMFEDFG
jgi:hypothetical protein